MIHDNVTDVFKNKNVFENNDFNIFEIVRIENRTNYLLVIKTLQQLFKNVKTLKQHLYAFPNHTIAF